MGIPNPFVVEHQSSFIIRCSFCKASARVDVPQYDEKDSRFLNKEVVARKQVAELAKQRGWKSAHTRHGVQLNFCLDHTNKAKEMGILE